MWITTLPSGTLIITFLFEVKQLVIFMKKTPTIHLLKKILMPYAIDFFWDQRTKCKNPCFWSEIWSMKKWSLSCFNVQNTIKIWYLSGNELASNSLKNRRYISITRGPILPLASKIRITVYRIIFHNFLKYLLKDHKNPIPSPYYTCL